MIDGSRMCREDRRSKPLSLPLVSSRWLCVRHNAPHVAYSCMLRVLLLKKRVNFSFCQTLVVFALHSFLVSISARRTRSRKFVLDHHHHHHNYILYYEVDIHIIHALTHMNWHRGLILLFVEPRYQHDATVSTSSLVRGVNLDGRSTIAADFINLFTIIIIFVSALGPRVADNLLLLSMLYSFFVLHSPLSIKIRARFPSLIELKF